MNGIHEVAGSIPASSTNTSVVQTGRVLRVIYLVAAGPISWLLWI